MPYLVKERIQTMSGGGREWNPGAVLHDGELPEHAIRKMLAEDLIEWVEPPAPIAPVEPVVEDGEPEEEPVEASRAAIKLAEKLEIDLSLVEGTGKGGNITKGNVARYAAEEAELEQEGEPAEDVESDEESQAQSEDSVEDEE